MVRVYETLLQNVKDLTEVAGQLGGAAGEYLLDECSAKVECWDQFSHSPICSVQQCVSPKLSSCHFLMSLRTLSQMTL